MTPLSPIETALFGLRENLERFEQTATRLARTAPGADLATDLVGLGQAETGVHANVKVIQASDELTSTLLDVYR